MNEAVYRSPKWLRNFVDYEINTGEDIKGQPSKKRQKQIDAENARKEAERIKAAREEAERKRQEKIEEEKRKQKAKEERFDTLFRTCIVYIQANYRECEISIPEDNHVKIKSKKLLFDNRIDFDFEITLLNEYRLPKFEVHLNFNNEDYDYTVSGLNYVDFKNFIVNTIYPYWKFYGNKQKQQSKQKSDYGYSDYSNSKQKTKEPEESEDVKNKRRRYKLLKDTLDGYQRQLKKIQDWERLNPGQKHPDNKEQVENQIKVVLGKIKLMKSMYQFESHTYSNIKPYEIY